ncbi:hypothetical protein TWF970_005728 [Orbilia oligospora]|uniref:Uncharacterized protein n=1 Tax=Orbilia oligospora TaxID=2813651 RepID=A0A7C8RG78_ORBOL|nr:hypothetical protein TWF970_005728 [Orbilia oligospora]
MKLTTILPLLLLQTTTHATIFNRARLPTVGEAEDLAAPTVVLKRTNLELTAPTAILKRARKAAGPDPEEQARPDDIRTKVVKRARPAPTVVGKRARKYADPDPEEQMGPIDPDSTRTRVAKRAKPAPTVFAERARKYADPDPEEQMGPIDPDSTRTRVAKRAKPAPTVVGKRARKYADPDPEEQLRPVDPDSTRTRVAKRAKPAPTVVGKRARKYADPDPEEQLRPVDPDSTRTRVAKRANPAPTVFERREVVDDQAPAAFQVITLPTGRIEVPVHAHTPISTPEINARPAGVLDSIGLNFGTLCSAFIPFTNAGTGVGEFPDHSGPRTGFTIGQLTWTGHFHKSWSSTDKSRPGWKYLSSSNILYKGYWVNVNITFKDLSWKPIIRSEVPVLVFNQKLGCEKIDNATGNCLVTPSILQAEGGLRSHKNWHLMGPDRRKHQRLQIPYSKERLNRKHGLVNANHVSQSQ